MAKTKSAPDWDMNVVSSSEARDILKAARARGSRRSKYSPIYDEVRGLSDGNFVVLRSVDKATKTSLYQGIRRQFDDDIKMASGRDKDASGEAYTVVIGHAGDYDAMRNKAKS